LGNEEYKCLEAFFKAYQALTFRGKLAELLIKPVSTLIWATSFENLYQDFDYCH
jgi:hypothetical protein